jgi:hypothetical protein
MAAGKQLSLLQIAGYGTGHVFNDICASMWFTYLLLFFQEVHKVQRAHSKPQGKESSFFPARTLLWRKCSNFFFHHESEKME